MTTWEVTYVDFNAGPGQTQLLVEGWEPFYVTCLGNPDLALIWLRREKVEGG